MVKGLSFSLFLFGLQAHYLTKSKYGRDSHLRLFFLSFFSLSISLTLLSLFNMPYNFYIIELIREQISNLRENGRS